MGGRGGASGFSVIQQLRIGRKNNQFPNSITGDPGYQNEVLRAVNKVYDYPADLKQFMNTDIRPGLKNVTVNPPFTDRHTPQREVVMVRAKNDTLRVSYTTGQNDADTAVIREGAIKFALINWWRRQGHALSFSD